MSSPHRSRSWKICWFQLFSHTTLWFILEGLQTCSSTRVNTEVPPEINEYNGTLYAACKMRPNIALAEGLPRVYGQVLLKQDYPEGKLEVLLRLHGFPSGSSPEPRAVHIHQYGENEGCDSTGGHYNPYKTPHPSHPGDFGNFEAHQGRIIKVTYSEATLFGVMSVLGRAVVVHEKVDDLGLGGDAGSLLHGNAGRRLACCTIGISSPKLWNRFYSGQQRRRGKEGSRFHA